MILPIIPYNASSIVSASIAPLDEIFVYSQLMQVTLDEVVVRAETDPVGPIGGFSTGPVLMVLYFLGVVIKLIQFLYRLLQLRLQISKSESIKTDDLRFVFTTKGSPTYSFLNWIFVDPDLLDNEDELKSILAHEQIHARQGHSVDLIVAEILTVIQWFNPFAYLLKKIMKENHEYLSDHEVITNYHDANSYRLLLLEHSSTLKTNILTHNFSYSLLKRRLKMMKRPKRPIRTGIGILCSIAALSLVFFACSTPTTEQNTNGIGRDRIAMLHDMEYHGLDVKPEFPGGHDSLYNFLGRNILRPSIAIENNDSAWSIVKYTIEKDGSVTSAEVLLGPIKECNEEVLKAVNSMPSWKPGFHDGKPVRTHHKVIANFTKGKWTDTMQESINISLDKNHNSKIESVTFVNDTKSDPVFTVVEQMPEFPGGMEALMKYLGENINYPEQAKKDKITGRVFVQFVIDKNGSIETAKVLRGIGGGCDEEALRVIQNMPDWRPGMQRGETVRVQYNIPIKFALD